MRNLADNFVVEFAHLFKICHISRVSVSLLESHWRWSWCYISPRSQDRPSWFGEEYFVVDFKIYWVKSERKEEVWEWSRFVFCTRAEWIIHDQFGFTPENIATLDVIFYILSCQICSHCGKTYIMVLVASLWQIIAKTQTVALLRFLLSCKNWILAGPSCSKAG